MLVVRSTSRDAIGRSLRTAADEASAWLFDGLLPLWARDGRDPAGGYYDQLDAMGAVGALPKRCRVQTRQIYVFAEAGRLGWSGPWRDCVEHGLAFLGTGFRRADGFLRRTVSATGEILDDDVDNYDQAFALFALAKAYAATSDAGLIKQALSLLAALRRARAHPLGGFQEASPPSVPLRSNPHMHLFEAAVAWIEAAGLAEFGVLAAELASLCAERFTHDERGCLFECFDLDWRPIAEPGGLVVEPGHQFEWAWLLLRWRALGGTVDLGLPRGLYAFATAHGLDHGRGVAINEVYHDGRIRDATARLWPQTERLKAALAMIELGEGSADELVAAWVGLRRYAHPEEPALFRDKLDPSGAFQDEAAFASSLYHITCAISELVRVAALHG